jgi:hypothetical protein
MKYPMSRAYSEGSVFLVPLRDGGYVRGVVARTSPNGKVLFGYFFGPRLLSTDTIALDDLNPSDSILTLRFGDLGLTKREWHVLGIIPNWDRSKWPMPDFVRRDDISHKAWLVRYSDNDPNCVETEFPIEFDAEMPRDSLSGYGAVEIKLSKLIGSERRNKNERADERSVRASAKNAEYQVHYYLYFPDRPLGEKVASDLRTQGYVVEDRLGADEVNWLVLVKSNAVPTSAIIDEHGKFFKQIAEENNGEYDGWEANIES